MSGKRDTRTAIIARPLVPVYRIPVLEILKHYRMPPYADNTGKRDRLASQHWHGKP